MAEKQIQMGDEVKDTLSGYQGIAAGFMRYLTGCDQILINPVGVDKEGKLRESHYFDVERVVVIEEQKVKEEDYRVPVGRTTFGSKPPGADEAPPETGTR